MAKKAAKKKKKTTRRKKADDGNALFKELEEKLAGQQAQPYRMNSEFPVNCMIEHPKFGVGFVFASTPSKIDVAFQDSNRALVQNRK